MARKPEQWDFNDDSTYCLVFDGRVRVVGAGTPSQSEIVEGPLAVFTDETIWIRPPLKQRFGFAVGALAELPGRALFGEAGGQVTGYLADKLIGKSKEQIVDTLNKTFASLMDQHGLKGITSEHVHEAFGDWCDTWRNPDITRVTISNKGWLRPRTHMTFRAKEAMARVTDGPPGKEWRELIFLRFTKAYGNRVQII